MTKSNSAFPIPHSIFWLAAILLVYFFGLTMPLVGPDEPRYAQVAREMFLRSDWITPTLGGFNWFEKPALLYWLQIASYNLFGITEFAARFGSALFGLGTVASMWILGRHLEPAMEDARPSVYSFGTWLGLITASTVAIVAFAHGASFDIILTFPMTAALVSFYIYDSSNRRESISSPLILFYFFIGISLLAKGLVGIVFPFAIVTFYHLLWRRFPTRAFLLSLIWGMAIAGIVAATWYLPMYLRHGYEFIDQFFIQHHFQRYTSNKYFHPQPFYFFFWVLPLMTIPWTPFFLAALWKFARRTVSPEPRKQSEQPTRPLLVFAFAWLAVPMVFFSFSGSKLPGYILPAVPAAIIFSAVYIREFAQKGPWRERTVMALAAGTFVVILAAQFAVVPRFAEADSVKTLFRTADDRGFGSASVLMLHTVSHNAEFYAPGRIMRDENGKQKKVYSAPEVMREIKQEGGEPILVLVPLEYLHQLTESDLLEADVLKDNGEFALVFVRGASAS